MREIVGCECKGRGLISLFDFRSIIEAEEEINYKKRMGEIRIILKRSIRRIGVLERNGIMTSLRESFSVW